jgi:hypothetical protein
VEVSTRSIEFTEAEREAFERRQRRAQADFERMAAAGTPEERERIAGMMWARDVEKPRMARRIEQARKPKLAAIVRARPAPRRTNGRSGHPRAHATRSSAASGDSPDPGDPDPAEPAWPARGLAVCPVCGNDPLTRSRCRFCNALGFVGRARRNAYKLGVRA